MLITNIGCGWTLQSVLLVGYSLMKMVIGLGFPILHVVFAVVEDLSSLRAMLVRMLSLARNDRTIVKQLKKTATVSG